VVINFEYRHKQIFCWRGGYGEPISGRSRALSSLCAMGLRRDGDSWYVYARTSGGVSGDVMPFFEALHGIRACFGGCVVQRGVQVAWMCLVSLANSKIFLAGIQIVFSVD
jgi:hypothetical protein